MQEHIISIHVNRDTTIATLLKLKESFIREFSGADQLRLLDHYLNGSYTPSQAYLQKLAALKKQYGIEY